MEGGLLDLLSSTMTICTLEKLRGVTAQSMGWMPLQSWPGSGGLEDSWGGWLLVHVGQPGAWVLMPAEDGNSHSSHRTDVLAEAMAGRQPCFALSFVISGLPPEGASHTA